MMVKLAKQDDVDALAAVELRGTGQPGSTTETNTAPVGTYYTDTTGTAGAWRWLKTSAGSGVAQWKVVYGDTGQRNITDLLDDALRDTVAATLDRVGNRVRLQLRGVFPTPNKTGLVLNLPAGFQKRSGDMAGTPGAQTSNMSQYAGATLYMATAHPVFTVYLAGTTAGLSLGFILEFTTSQAWPTTLPGTPA